MRPACRGLLALLTTLGLCCAAARGQPPLRADKDVNDILETVRKKHKLPALAGAIVTSKGVVAVGAVGVRKAGTNVPVTIDDQFHIGSDTKAMTAVLIARLIEEGRLAWDTPLDRAFPDLADAMNPALKKVTLLQLLTHRSGLSENLKGGWHGVVSGDDPRKQRLAAVKKALAAAPEHEPGKKYHYSNLGYVVAAAAAERAANDSWEALMRKKVFGPLGMKSAGFGPPGTPGKVDQPLPHDGDGNPLKLGPGADNPKVMGPAGTVHCSLPDWGKFIADQLRGSRGKGALLRAETYKKLHASPFPDHFYTPGGWAGQEIPGGVVLAHAGSNGMNYATALLIPHRDVAVLVATNRGGDLKVMDRICGEAAVELLEHFSRKKRP